MKNIFSASIAIIAIILVALLAGVFVHINLQVQSAREYHSAIIERIQAGYYSEYVIQDCIAKARNSGYDVQIEKTAIYEEIADYYVALQYEITVPLLHTKMPGTIEGYAR